MGSNFRTTLYIPYILGTLLIASCSQEAPVPDVIRPVKAFKVGDASSFETGTLTGKAKATEEINIAFEVSGRIVELPIDVGDVVEQGQVLSRLDPRDFENAVAVAAAEMERAGAQKERVRKAAASNAVSAQDVTNADAQAAAAEASHRIAVKRLEDTTITAPFGGRIAAKYVENFSNVIAKQKILRLLDISKVEMIVDVPERLIPRLRFVKSIQVTFTPFPDLKLDASVKEVGSEASSLTRTYPVTLIMDQPEGVEILPGMAGEAFGRAELPPEELAGGVTIPPGAVVSSSSGDQSYVWTVDKTSGAVSKSPVEIDRFSRFGVVVTSGLEPGQWIATAGVHSLTEGQRVRILEGE